MKLDSCKLFDGLFLQHPKDPLLSKLVLVLFILFILLTWLVPCYMGQSIYPQVTLKQGILRGRPMRTEDDKEFFGFLGIPYAKPPIGPLRFKQPVPHPGWSGLADAWTYKASCPQLDTRGVDTGNEDCLYLNVYTPSVERTPFNNFLYPVMVFIGAGTFETGDSSLYGPQKIMDKGIVLVTFNHRIGLLGFLSSDDESASGNWGLYDQLLVLQWIKSNIESFSGDPSSVTIFGQGAGAASVFFHLISPLSKGLFHKAILESGSGLCDWALQSDPWDYAVQIGQRLRCPITPRDTLIECLRVVPTLDLLRAQSNGKILGEYPIKTVPVVEKGTTNRFLPQDPWQLLTSGIVNRVPVLIGYNTQETLFFYPEIEQAFREESGRAHEKLTSDFLDCCTPFKGRSKERVVPLILYEYFNKMDPFNSTQVASRFIDLSTDALFISCIDETVRILWELNLPVYLYIFDYRGQNSMVERIISKALIPVDTGPSHGDELFYIFDMKLGTSRNQPFRDKKVSQRITSLWTDFAKFGYAPRTVTPEYPRWNKFNTNHPTALYIGGSLGNISFTKTREAQFWSKNLKNLSGINPHMLARIRQARPLYKTLAWTMIGVSLSLLIMVILLLSILFYQRRSSSFRAGLQNGSSHTPTGSSGLY
ncbi:carboxylesterase 4A isoform X2 [Tetranychus urticae]|uniref:Carboxylesterase type B domain-containing protein n=1 Tax=Tetranychus urticae TaxID=32264 RepID=T1K2U9_TETUR|nr:carboxylesterase 4A isoform X2 [Tetranychus urticae]